VKEIKLKIESEMERRLVVKVFDDGSIDLIFDRMASWETTDGKHFERNWVSDHVGAISIEDMKSLGDAIIKASKLLVLM
jgi:hypothetical protein